MGGIYREKAVQRVKRPEDLNDYVGVTTPSVWIVLIAVLLLLAGILAWTIFGSVDVHNEDGSVTETHPISFVTN